MKSRNCELIVYTEHCPNIFALEELCAKLCKVYFISPVHKDDIYEKDTNEHKKGDKKKPHFHCICVFENARHFSSVANDFVDFGITEPLINKVYSLNGAVRYLCHLDSPDKAHYDISLIRTNTKNLKKYLEPSEKKSQAEITGELCELIFRESIYTLSALVKKTHELGIEYTALVSSKAYFFCNLVRENSRIVGYKKTGTVDKILAEMAEKEKNQKNIEKELDIF